MVLASGEAIRGLESMATLTERSTWAKLWACAAFYPESDLGQS